MAFPSGRDCNLIIGAAVHRRALPCRSRSRCRGCSCTSEVPCSCRAAAQEWVGRGSHTPQQAAPFVSSPTPESLEVCRLCTAPVSQSEDASAQMESSDVPVLSVPSLSVALPSRCHHLDVNIKGLYMVRHRHKLRSCQLVSQRD